METSENVQVCHTTVLAVCVRSAPPFAEFTPKRNSVSLFRMKRFYYFEIHIGKGARDPFPPWPNRTCIPHPFPLGKSKATMISCVPLASVMEAFVRSGRHGERCVFSDMTCFPSTKTAAGPSCPSNNAHVPALLTRTFVPIYTMPSMPA